MKACCTCKIKKSLDCFHKSKSHPGGLYQVCKECRKISSKSFRLRHGEKIREKWREWYKNNPDQHREKSKKYQKNNWEYRKAYMRQWTKNNPGKANAHTALRYAAKTKCTPKWLTKEHKKQIEWFYETAKELEWLSEDKLTVDHIEPLRGEISCGLHVPWNLQIIPARINYSKGNKLVN